MSSREPLLNPVPIKSLRPTQITVGYREVGEKRREWRERAKEHGDHKLGVYLGQHMIPVVRGPKAESYVIDHHHLCRALMEEGVKEIAVNVVLDLGALKMSEFWTFMDNRALCHPYDAAGARVGFKAIPAKIADLHDDPYRSLAGELRRAGGYAKDVTPFSEFIWADFLRRRVKAKLVAEDFGSALTRALKLAKSPEAGHLPGWCGPNSAD
ncbi:ParB-like protein [Phenylobacterium sp.]|uniref:ParB-like protein n=1 Tax=Phenylobacterium sp. TaxID=1871053 RepID=UPI00120B74AF|nr:ParB-like protein [Phenylobacterium sp.]THD64771.1 MAG: chromosome partitioning protein ParB [Phenylobacterium sp.]